MKALDRSPAGRSLTMSPTTAAYRFSAYGNNYAIDRPMSLRELSTWAALLAPIDGASPHAAL